MVYTIPENITHYADLYVWAYQATNGVSSYGILLLIFSIAFIGTQRYGAATENALLVSLTATVMSGGALMMMGALGVNIMSILVILLALSYIYTYHAN